MAGIEIRFNVVDPTRFDEFESVFFANVRPRMEAGLAKVEGEAKGLAPRYKGFFGNAIQPLIESPAPATLQGFVFSSAPYASIIEGVDEQGNEVEFGRRPGTRFPNLTQLRIWVEFRLGPGIREAVGKAVKGLRALKQKVTKQQRVETEEEQIDEATYAIGRAIARRGIKPTRPIGTAFKANEAFINRQIDEGLDAALNRL